MSQTQQNVHSAPVERWLRNKIAQEVKLNLFLAALALVFGSIIVLFTYVGVYVFLSVVFPGSGMLDYLVSSWDHTEYLKHVTGIGLLALLGTAMLFVVNARSSPEEYLSFDDSRRGINSAVSSLKLVLDVLFIGPRLISSAKDMMDKCRRVMAMDVVTCARVLAMLALRNSRLSYVQLSTLPGAPTDLRVYGQLRDIDGVLFLVSEPPGLSLMSELREELRDLLMGEYAKTEPFARHGGAKPPPRTKSRYTPRPEPEPKAEPEPEQNPKGHGQSAYAILGISQKASLSEIKAAYRSRIKAWHPDKFGEYGPEWQAMAEEQAKIINNAYKELTGKRIRIRVQRR